MLREFAKNPIDFQIVYTPVESGLLFNIDQLPPKTNNCW